MSYVPFLIPSSWADWRAWLKQDFPDVIGIVIALVIAHFVFQTVIKRLLYRTMSRTGRSHIEDAVAIERRARTLVATLDWSFDIFLIVLGVSLVLENIGLNVSALIAGVGVVGIAVGFGAQTMIKDLINGTFILIEDQYSVGDIVTVAGVTGEVVAINPRRTVVRDMDGSIHSIPNGAITVATNMTQGFSRINLDLSIPGSQDLTRSMNLVDQVGKEMLKERHEDLLNAPHVLRIESIGESRVQLKVVGDTRAGKQWEMTGELLKRVLQRFKDEGIAIFPTSTPPAEPPATAPEKTATE